MTCFVVFGRRPVAGKVKTRLARTVGGETAAAVYDILLRATVRRAVEASDHVVLSLAEPPGGGFVAPEGVRVEVQSGGDLGERMREAFARRFAEGCGAAAIVGSDAPGLTAEHLRDADRQLRHERVVLGPARDGGYWLVGQRAPGVDLFSGVPWSSPDTLDATRRRLRGLGAAWRELDTLDDIDTEDDLDRLLRTGALSDDLRERLRAALGGER